MRRIRKKFYSILLIILMLVNYMPAIVNAVDDTTARATLALESKASKYNIGDIISVDLKVTELTNLGLVKQYASNISYDSDALEIQEIIPIHEGYSNTSEIQNSRIVITKASGEGTIGVGDIICTIKFKALKSSNTSTTIKLSMLDITCNDKTNAYFEDNNVNEPEITLPVESSLVQHTLKITKTDNAGMVIANNKALFKITKLNGEIVFKETDETGIIELPNLEITDTAQNYTYTIEEILAPTGYKINETPLVVAVTFDDEGKVLTAIPNTSENVSIIEQTNTIDVKISNEVKEVEPEQEVFNLVINKVDELNASITTDTAEFTLTMPDGTAGNYATQENGKTQNIPVVAPDKAGTYTYLIKETKAPNGYKVEVSNIIVELTYEKQENKIVLVSGKVVSYNDEAITITNNDVRTATINIKNQKEIITYNYTVNIEKVKNDTFKSNITEDTAIFEITKDNQTSYVKTNQLGKANYEFSMTNKEINTEANYVYTIKEIKAPNGYILDEEEKTLTLTFNEDGSIKTAVVNGNNIEEPITTTNAVNIKIVNEKEPEEITLEPQDFELLINKVDENNNLITTDSANFVLTTGEGATYTLTTQKGTTKIVLKAPETVGKTVYFLKETKAPEGYNILNESLVIEANFVEVEGKIVLSSAKIKEYNKDITPLNNTLTIDVINEKQIVEEPETYIIKVSGVDGNNNPIENGTIVVKLTDKTTGQYIYKEVPVKNGSIELEMPKAEGTISYELEQIKSAEGYEINPNPIQITVDFAKNTEGKNEISNYTVIGEGATKGENTKENVIEVIIVNNEIKVEPEKQNYWLEINKLDSETKELINRGSAIFTVIDSEGNLKEYGTTNGKILINEIVPGEVGESNTLIIKEKTAPEGYKLTQETIVLKLEFVELNGKVIVTNPEILLGNSISEVLKTEDNNIKLNIINEKEDEDLYVVSKKDANQIDIYNLFDFYTGRHYSIDKPFIDTKVAIRGGTVSVQTFMNNLESNGVLTVWDKDGNQIANSERIKTGMILKATKGKQQKQFTIIAKGDCDGDGRVRTLDLDKLIDHIAGNKITDPIALRAIDLVENSGDGIIRTTDLNEFYYVLAR